MNLFLEIFLLIDAFLIGIVATVAVRHGLAHFRPEKHDAEKARHQSPDTPLPPEIKKQMQAKAAGNFEALIDKYSSQLQKDLRASEDNLTARLEKLSADIVSRETDRYRQELEKLHAKVEATDKSAESEIKKSEDELKAQMEQEIAEQKQRKLEQLDAKISDAVTSFLLETLGHDVDLGAQSKYLTAQLEAHKAEIIKGVSDEA